MTIISDPLPAGTRLPGANAQPRPAPILAAVAVFLVLFGAYLLSFSGRLHSIDEHSMLAVTESLAKGTGVRTNQNLWHVDFAYPSDTFGIDGHVYSKKGPATSLVALPFYWLALQAGNVAPGHAAMLSTLVVSAATGAVLVLLVWRLGGSTASGVFVALAWGLATMAWPYARYFFSEPTATLFLVLGWYWLMPDRRDGSPRLPGLPAVALSGLALGAAATTRVPYLAALPVFGLYLLATRTPWPLRGLQSLPWRAGLVWAAGVALPLAAYGIYNLARFGNPLSAGFVSEESFSLPFWEGALGMLLSPGRSLFLFAPVVLLGVVLWPRLLRWRPVDAWLVLAICVGHLLLYGGWYMWWGGLAWGPRFLVPLLPFALVPLVVLPGSTRWRIAAAAALAAGVLVNSAGVLASFTDATEATSSFSPANWSLRQNSLIQQFRLVRPEAFDLAWWHGGNVDLLAILLGAIVIVLGIGLLIARRVALPPIVAAAAVAIALVAGWGSITRYYDPSGASEQLRAAIAALREQPADMSIVLGTPLRADWLAIYAPLPKPPTVVAKNSVERDPRVARTLELIAAEQPRTAFAIEYTAAGDPTSLAEAVLDGHAYKADTRWFGDEIRLVEYLRPGASSGADLVAGLTLGSQVGLERYGLEVLGAGAVEGDRVRVRPGDRIGLRLEWRALELPESPISTDYTVFAHVERTAAGLVLAQNDRPPVDGLRPTSSWTAGERITDLRVITIPPDAPSGESFDLVVGLYDPQTGARLPVQPADAASTAVRHSPDAALLATVLIE